MSVDFFSLDIYLLFYSHRPGYFASLYRKDNLTGGHVIKLGPGNDAAAEEALAAWPDGLQIGGGITIDNAISWLDKGASKVMEDYREIDRYSLW